ncbi:putative TetR-family transcriptional regulator [Actinoplanes missouriensis 431]|uniref:Putative TetR-family transcriptional regulator n=1 Tax=Actinoplanes missouriensis (strain ATCC 14538 / DSM 43046 / CBS 188.64 / JCM 3121 / NBRC 102363 / NCIMB 12654 / NRRL B-3342 / UNCC 431) TaxID=512565 RepID=I0H358_ACTM4|nr:TetR/AcrR family transcriptional regulator [Actinoplanes missouriensis]BAL87445.1 putative TetR-family transcriptional regulator [Actinoplanes missouriensis 431]
MGRTAGRSPEDTRRVILESAGEVIRTRGLNASLDDIARHAGVSKGGLIYHFASKDELVLALARTLLARFRDHLAARLDPADDAPGRFTRAYIRALLAPIEDEVAARREMALTSQLSTVPAVAELVAADTAELNAELAADGLPADVLTLVTAAADGVSVAPMWGGPIATPEHRELEKRLIQLTRWPELWQSVPWPDQATSRRP